MDETDNWGCVQREQEARIIYKELLISGVIDDSPSCSLWLRDQPAWLKRLDTGSILDAKTFWYVLGLRGGDAWSTPNFKTPVEAIHDALKRIDRSE